jgi:nitrogen fixation NifU-like protein
MDLRELYQDIILDHGRYPRNFRALEVPSHVAHGHNPLCGDKVVVYVNIADGIVTDVSFEGQGCAISVASASLMTEILKGKTLDDARLLFTNFHASVTGGPPNNLPEELEEDAERLHPLAGVKSYPARVKCATLAWHTFDAALRKEEHVGGA